jgi:ketosteroid isomerase-like protein
VLRQAAVPALRNTVGCDDRRGTHRGRAGVGALFGEPGKHLQEPHVERRSSSTAATPWWYRLAPAPAAAGSYDQTIVHLWRMHDGKAVSFTEFIDAARVLQVIGLETGPST